MIPDDRSWRKGLGEQLGFDVAVRVEAFLVGRISPNVVVFPAEIREIVVVGDAFLHPVDFSEFERFVPGGLGLRRFELKPGIPGTTIRTVESAAERMGMRKGRVDDVVTRNAGHQLVDADTRQPIVLGEQAVIGRVVQSEDAVKVVIIVGDPVEHAFPALTVLRGNEPVRIELPDAYNDGVAQ